MRLLPGLALVFIAATVSLADETSDKLIGKWVVMKGPAPPGATIEYSRDGTMKLRATVGGKDVEFSGTYTVRGQQVTSKITYNGRPVTETHTIRKLTADVLHVADAKGQIQECGRDGTAAAKPPAGEQPAVGRARFSPDAIDLFKQITNAYDLNGKRQPAGAFDIATMARLNRQGTPAVRKLAEGAAQLKWLSDQNKAQGAEVRKAFENQAAKWPGLIVGRVAALVAAPKDQRADITDAVSILEDLMGEKPQEAVNKAWAVACLGNGTANALKEEIRTLARSDARADPAPKYALDVVIDKGYSITVINQTRGTLHNGVLFTRLVSDRDRVLRAAEEEDVIGQFVLPLLGFSDKTVTGSREAARLRYNFHLQDKGVMVYLPELPPGGSVTTSLANPAYFGVAKGADISLWCDEWSVEHQPARNWDDLKAPPRPTRPVPKKKSKEHRTAEILTEPIAIPGVGSFERFHSPRTRSGHFAYFFLYRRTVTGHCLWACCCRGQAEHRLHSGR